MFYSDDPVRDFDNYDRYQQRLLERLPKCADCDEHIADDHFFRFDGKYYCPDCLNYHHKIDVEDYIEENRE